MMNAIVARLTDLIAAEIAMHRFVRDEGDDEFGICSCLKWRGSESFPTHVALVVEQHIAGRIAELEASTRGSVRVLVMERHRAEKAEATIARVRAVEAEYLDPEDADIECREDAWRFIRDFRAALEGEQQ